jgi:hypothetical protein
MHMIRKAEFDGSAGEEPLAQMLFIDVEFGLAISRQRMPVSGRPIGAGR